jgi:CBS domain-containing protein
MICPRCGRDNLPGSDVCDRCLLDLAPLDQPAGQDRVESSLMEDHVAVLHPRAPVTVGRATPLRETVRVMLDHGVGSVLVVDERGRLVGIFSERDLLMRLSIDNGRGLGATTGELMTPNPETVGMADTLARVLHKMDVGRYRHLPVVDGELPIGMISVRDIVRHITRLCKE